MKGNGQKANKARNDHSPKKEKKFPKKTNKHQKPRFNSGAHAHILHAPEGKFSHSFQLVIKSHHCTMVGQQIVSAFMMV